jgi:adenine-specific DNA-methyltransferase
LYVAKTKNKKLTVKFLVALLSSRLITFLYQNGIYGQKKRALAQFRIYALYSIPTPDLEKVSQTLLIDLVDKILAITKDNDYLENPSKQAKVRDYEKQIDQMVYKLYGLTKEEIKIVENNK